MDSGELVPEDWRAAEVVSSARLSKGPTVVTLRCVLTPPPTSVPRKDI